MSQAGILGQNIDELIQLCAAVGYGAEEAKKLAYYLYRKSARSFMEMEALPKALRAILDERYTISLHPPIKAEFSEDGTKKYLFKTEKGNLIEAAYMPGAKRNTLCISTQAGCRMGCSFCLTGTIGFHENLSVNEILNQLISLPERGNVNRIVFMGMGEPLDNFENVRKSLEILTANWGMAFGAANITVSTVGIPAPLEELFSLGLCNIAISLHSPFSEERMGLMPIEKRHPIAKTLTLARELSLPKTLRLSFEYILLNGVNDSPAHAFELAKILAGIKCHVNLIPLNGHQSTTLASPTTKQAHDFQRQLNTLGIGTTLRTSRGGDISAACGQFSASSKQ